MGDGGAGTGSGGTANDAPAPDRVPWPSNSNIGEVPYHHPECRPAAAAGGGGGWGIGGWGDLGGMGRNVSGGCVRLEIFLQVGQVGHGRRSGLGGCTRRYARVPNSDLRESLVARLAAEAFSYFQSYVAHFMDRKFF